MHAVGDARRGPHGREVRCFDASGWRSSRWVDEDGTAFRLLHRPERWSRALPLRCDEHGAMCFGGHVRVEQALARAWLPLACPPLRHPSAARIDARQPLCAGNVQWQCSFRGVARGGDGGGQNDEGGADDGDDSDSFSDDEASTVIVLPAPRLAPCVAKALDLAASVDALEDLSTACGTSVETALGYLSKGVCKDETRACPARLLAMLDPTLVGHVRARIDSDETLSALMVAVKRALPGALRGTPLGYAQLRLARLCLLLTSGRYLPA